MIIDNEAFDEIRWGDHEDFEEVTDVTIEDQTRWSIYKSMVYKQKSTGKFFRAFWGEGATENQEGQDEPWSFVEVEPFERTIIDYATVKGGQRYESE